MKTAAGVGALTVAMVATGYQMMIPKHSYHILKEFGTDHQGVAMAFWWPLGGFGQYCTNEQTALDQFKAYQDKEPNVFFQLVRYDLVTNWWGSPLEITGECKMIKD